MLPTNHSMSFVQAVPPVQEIADSENYTEFPNSQGGGSDIGEDELPREVLE